MDPRSSTVDGVLTRSARRTPTASRWTSPTAPGPTASSTTRSPGRPGCSLALGAGAGRPGRRLRAELRRLPARLPRLRARRAGPRSDQLRAHRRGAGLPGRAVRASRRCSSTRRWPPTSTRSDTAPKQVAPAARRRGCLLDRASTGRRPGVDDRRRRHRPGAAALHLGHDLAAQGRDDDPPRAACTTTSRVHRAGTATPTTTPLHADAAVPLGGDARVHAALPVGRRRSTT